MNVSRKILFSLLYLSYSSQVTTSDTNGNGDNKWKILAAGAATVGVAYKIGNMFWKNNSKDNKNEKENEYASIAAIQRIGRGHIERQNLQKQKAAQKIQKVFQGHETRKVYNETKNLIEAQKTKDTLLEEQKYAANIIQKTFRSHSSRKHNGDAKKTIELMKEYGFFNTFSDTEVNNEYNLNPKLTQPNVDQSPVRKDILKLQEFGKQKRVLKVLKSDLKVLKS